MRILDQDTDRPILRASLFLTTTEAQELQDSLALLLDTGSHHEHVSSEDFSREITLTIYDKHPVSSYDDRSRELIEEDK